MSLGVRPGGGAAAGFRRDVLRLVEHARAQPDRRGGIPLLWTVPWDGTVSLNYGDLDELYVEICRRVRLERAEDGAITARAAGSKCARVAAAELKGMTEDPWADQGRSLVQPYADGRGIRLSPDGDAARCEEDFPPAAVRAA